jgi:hypothetical protein
MRALPSAVTGLVHKLPCSRQRTLPLSRGFWHTVPLPGLAPQLWRGRSRQKRHLLPTSNLTFVTANALAFIGTILVYLRQHFEVPVALPVGREPSKINLIGIDQNYRLAPQAACKMGAALFWGHGFWVQFWGATYLDAVTLFTDF